MVQAAEIMLQSDEEFAVLGQTPARMDGGASLDEKLTEVLLQVRRGQTTFEPAGDSIEDTQNFQATANALIHAHKMGLLRSCVPHDDARTGVRLYDLVLAGGLTHEGTLALRDVAESTQRMEAMVTGYLHSASFQEHYPRAYEKWVQAERLLYSTDSAEVLTTIGHLAREAMQEFAAELVLRVGPATVDSDPTKTVSRIRSVLDSLKSRTGENERRFLDALLVYWGTVSDLAQRQEHGALKEGASLVWRDGRRVVFQVAIVIFEIDEAVTVARG